MSEAYIVQAARTAIGAFGGALADIPAAELGAAVARAVLERAGVTPDAVDDVLMGNVLAAGLGQNVARQIAMAAGVPQEKTAMSVNMVCGSGLRSIALAAQAVRLGDAEVVIAGGVENMSAAPYLLAKARYGYRMGNGEIVDAMVQDGLWEIFNGYHMGVTAENLAERYGITRAEQDAFAARSQNRAEAAMASGRFKDEIVAVAVPQRKGEPLSFDVDEHPRPGVTVESISKLRPAFKPNGTVTAANASGVNDGAAAALVMSEKAMERLGAQPMARIASYAWAGVDPAFMGLGPTAAVPRALDKAGWTLADVELVEANEAFAAQTLAVARELAWNDAIVNVNGGAIALGHPIGASGARILTTLLHEMIKRDVRKGLATLCVGGGMGVAMCVER